MTENSVPNGSVMAAIRPFGMSWGASDAPPVAVARAAAASVSATSKMVTQVDEGASGRPKIPPTSWPSGRRRKVKSRSGRSSILSAASRWLRRAWTGRGPVFEHDKPGVQDLGAGQLQAGLRITGIDRLPAGVPEDEGKDHEPEPVDQ